MTNDRGRTADDNGPAAKEGEDTEACLHEEGNTPGEPQSPPSSREFPVVGGAGLAGDVQRQRRLLGCVTMFLETTAVFVLVRVGLSLSRWISCELLQPSFAFPLRSGFPKARIQPLSQPTPTPLRFRPRLQRGLTLRISVRSSRRPWRTLFRLLVGALFSVWLAATRFGGRVPRPPP